MQFKVQGMCMPVTCSSLLFDLDGTLVDSSSRIERKWTLWCAENDVALAPVLSACLGRQDHDTLSSVAPSLNTSSQLCRLRELEESAYSHTPATPGARALLSGLAAEDWAVVTSAWRTLAKSSLQQAGLPSPQVLVCSEDVVLGKPNPEGYRTAARRLGRCPTTCVVVEDSPAGASAGRAAGARVLGVGKDAVAQELGDWNVDELAWVELIQEGDTD